MTRPKTPHCKDCIHCMDECLTWRITVRARYSHYCLRNGKSKYISGQEYRNSPLWCPRRIGFQKDNEVDLKK